MKNLILGIVLMFFGFTVNAEIIYLNNNLEETNKDENIFITWEDAYNEASAGDSIYIIGSNFNHGSVTISKPLIIIGPGFFLNENLETQVNKKTALFNKITFETGSDGSAIYGVSSVYSGIEINAGINDITIENCYLAQIYFYTLNDSKNNNVKIKRCFFYRYSGITHYRRTGIYQNLVISNNIFLTSVSIPDGSDGLFLNNLLLHNTLDFGETSSFEVANNIYLNTNDEGLTIHSLPSSSVHHNLSVTGIFGDEVNGNIKEPAGTIFVGENNQTTDGQYQLAEKSPARGAGDKGTDMGPFGGVDPYRLSGLPNLPNIYEIVTGGFVVGDTLPVRVKIKQLKQ